MRTTRVFWVYVAATLAFVPFSVALSLTTGRPHAPLGSSVAIRNVMSAAAAGGLMMLLVGIALTTLAVALPWLDAKAVRVGLASADVAVPVLGSILVTMPAAVVGVAVGAVIQAQTLAITIVVVWTAPAEAPPL